MNNIQAITIAFQMINILILLMELRKRLKNKSDLSASKKPNQCNSNWKWTIWSQTQTKYPQKRRSVMKSKKLPKREALPIMR